MLLRETLESVWKQTVLPDEILIGDDSRDDETEKLVRLKLIPASPVPIRYFHHQPSLKEAGNVDFLYAAATGDLLLHLHDDDPIYPRCLELLKPPLQEFPQAVASFGMQHIIAEDGQLVTDPGTVNSNYFRTPDRAGLVSGLIAGAVAMFPNNGFLVRKEIASTVGYADHGRAGLAADFYFGFRLGQLRRPFYFVPEVTGMVRLTGDSLSRTGARDNAYRTVKILMEDLRSDEITKEIEQSLRCRIPIAITIAAQRKERGLAWRWLFSRYYRGRLLTLRGLKRLFHTLLP